jgi:drug/metabolite transporter (DMT)-like permease
VSRRSLFLLLVLSATWGASYLFIDLSLRGLSAPVVVFGRLAIGAAVLCVLARARNRRPFAALRGDWPRIALFALFEMVLPYLLIAFGQSRIATGTASLLVSTQMLWLVLLTPLMVRGARVRAVQLAGVGVGLVGVAALVQPFGAGGAPDAVGAVLVTLAAASYAIGSLLLGLLLPGRPTLPVTAAGQAVAAVLVAPVAAVGLPRALPAAGTFGALAVLGVACTAGGFLLFNVLITRSGAGTASLVAYLAPVFSLAYGALALHEPFTVSAAAGLVLIVAGTALTVSRRRRAVQPNTEPAPAAVRVGSTSTMR